MNENQPVKSKYSHCPACKTSLFYDRGGVPPSIRAVYTMSEILGFKYQCSRCYYPWFEDAAPVEVVKIEWEVTKQ